MKSMRDRPHDNARSLGENHERWLDFERRFNELVELGIEPGSAREQAGWETGVLGPDRKVILDPDVDPDDPARRVKYEQRFDRLVAFGVDRGVAQEVAGMEAGVIGGDIECVATDDVVPSTPRIDARSTNR